MRPPNLFERSYPSRTGFCKPRFHNTLCWPPAYRFWAGRSRCKFCTLKVLQLLFSLIESENPLLNAQCCSDLSVEILRAIPVNCGQISVKHNLEPANRVKSAIGECRDNQACLNWHDRALADRTKHIRDLSRKLLLRCIKSKIDCQEVRSFFWGGGSSPRSNFALLSPWILSPIATLQGSRMTAAIGSRTSISLPFPPC